MASRFQHLLLVLATSATAHLVPRWTPDAVAVVDLAVNRGEPQHYASGVIYGIPDTPDQIPDHFYTDIGLHWFRAGGAQMDAPNRGWVWGELDGRWDSALSNYKTARKYGGKFQLLLHDLWGTDHADESINWPGDNGDWSDYDNFLNVVVDRIVANGMLPGLHIDIWNEPEWGFWLRSQSQYLDLFGRTFKRFRNFLSYVAANDTAPDYYSWHHIEALDNEANDLQNSLPTFDRMRVAAGAPEKPININEYLNLGDELNPAATVWHLSRFERYNVPGLRANWRGGPNGTHLRDFLASLLWRDTTDLPYHPNGDWQALKYYNMNMTGYRAGTTGSEDRLFDAYATVGDKVRILTGTWGFTYVIPETELDAPTNRGIATHTYSNDEITIAIYQTEEDWKTAWAFEFSSA
ncbi:hypothetical protein G7Z17_g362 [Cylindrodendrum hubeiense]|uniref:Uncharacterized protein n=1 Tax=Cylindrodendrum hubeiense TaxID=595255 RepID=A0A9P5HLI8_9HYPO|nr:hypothetical protein G7Z17_g362 [Cylindrodendrum hubeiense]